MLSLNGVRNVSKTEIRSMGNMSALSYSKALINMLLLMLLKQMMLLLLVLMRLVRMILLMFFLMLML